MSWALSKCSRKLLLNCHLPFSHPMAQSGEKKIFKTQSRYSSNDFKVGHLPKIRKFTANLISEYTLKRHCQDSKSKIVHKTS